MKRDRLRVAILSHMSNSYGGSAYFQGLVPALGQYGKDTDFTVIASNSDPGYAVTGCNVQIRKMPFPKRGGRYARLLWEQRVLSRTLDKLDIDVIYTATNIGLLSAKKPFVIAIRNMDPITQKTGPEPFLLHLNSRLRGIMSNASINKAARIVAVSGFVKDVLIDRGTDPDKIDVIYHGIDDVIPSCNGNTGHAAIPYMFAAAKFVRYANLDNLVRAYHRIRQYGFTGKLKLAGGSLDHRYEHEIRALIKELGLSSHIEILGYIPRQHVQNLIKGCSVFLHASKLEACPFILLEAMKQEVPIVTTTAGPMKEICGEAALYADPDDYMSFAKNAYDIYSSEEKNGQLRQKAKERAKSFTWESTVKTLVSTLQKAADSAA